MRLCICSAWRSSKSSTPKMPKAILEKLDHLIALASREHSPRGDDSRARSASVNTSAAFARSKSLTDLTNNPSTGGVDMGTLWRSLRRSAHSSESSALCGALVKCERCALPISNRKSLIYLLVPSAFAGALACPDLETHAHQSVQGQVSLKKTS